MTDEDFRAHAEAAARSLGLKPDAESMTAVVANLKMLHAMAGHFADLPLDDHLDPATVLRL